MSLCHFTVRAVLGFISCLSKICTLHSWLHSENFMLYVKSPVSPLDRGTGFKLKWHFSVGTFSRAESNHAALVCVPIISWSVPSRTRDRPSPAWGRCNPCDTWWRLKTAANPSDDPLKQACVDSAQVFAGDQREREVFKSFCVFGWQKFCSF